MRARASIGKSALSLLAQLARRTAPAASKGNPAATRAGASEDARTLIAADLAVGGRDGRLEITDAGRAHLARLEILRSGSGLDPFLGQHLGLAQAEIETAHGRASVTIDAAESPLAWLARRKGRDGRALIEPVQFQAGERLRADFTLAQLMPRDGEHYWRHLMEFRGSWGHRTDYRIWLGVVRGPRGPLLHWRTTGEVRPRKGGRIIDFTHNARRPRVPLGEWFRFKVRWVFDRVHGRLKATVNGIPIVNHRGRTRVSDRLNTEQIFKVYTGANSLARGPAFQWIDDVELRSWHPRR